MIVLFAACNDYTETNTGSTQKGILFVSGLNDPATRISQDGSEWMAGDRIGIYMFGSGQTTAPDQANVPYSAESSAPTTAFKADEAPLSYPVKEEPVDFIAYYPYSEKVTDMIYPIDLADQSASLVAHDLMYAKADNNGNGYTYGSVSLAFTHQLSKITLNITDENKDVLAPDGITIKGMYTQGTFNVSTGALIKGTTKGDILPYKNKDAYEAILMPAFTFAPGHEVAMEIAGQSYVWKMQESYGGLEIKAGYSYTFHMTVDTSTGEIEAILVDFNGNSIAPWGNGGSHEEHDFGLPEYENDGLIRAFPGAEGGGMFTTGGRGGKVIKVTNLNDSGAGSLRAALETSGPRTIVFEVSGIIELQKTLEVKYGDVTIAGQTAPGDGICLKNYSLVVKANNVIIRFIRSRMGDQKGTEDDAMWGRYLKNVIIDHCSMSWSTDECSSFYANENFTMQWCILSESLRRSTHAKGNHGYGAIWGGVNASFHHNLLAHHDSRNPRFDGGDVYGISSNPLTNDQRAVDFRNCVVYNYSNYPAYGGEAQKINFVGNYYKWGPGSINGPDADTKGKKRKYFYFISGVKGDVDYGCPSIYMDNTNYLDSSGNDDDQIRKVNKDNWEGMEYDTKNQGSTKYTQLETPVRITTPDGKPVSVTYHQNAADAFKQVLDYAGASLVRDAVDERATSDTRQGIATYMQGSNGSLNGYIDSPQDVGGWPTYKQEKAPKDSDGDGIPDYWEDLYGLDKENANDGNAKTLDPSGRYTNLEIYLHDLVKDIVKGQVKGGMYTPL